MLKYCLYIASGVILTFLLVTLLVPQKTPFTPRQYTPPDLNIPDLKSSAYPSEDTLSFSFHYHKIVTHFHQPFFKETPHGFVYRPDEALKKYYLTNYYLKEDTLISQIAYYSLSLFYFYNKEYNLCNDHLLKIKNRSLPELQNMAGYFRMKEGHYDIAEKLFKSEIKLTQSASAYRNLITVLYWQEKHDELEVLLKNPKTQPYFSRWPQLIQEINFIQGNFEDYLKSALKIKVSFIGFAGAFFITIVWFVFLYKIDLFKKTSLASLIFVLLLGIIFTYFLTPILYDICYIYLDFKLNGEIINDLLFCIFGIGLIEELIKILPLLIILRYPGMVKEPVDYIIFASCSALGFAFVENLVKFDTDNIDSIDGRAFVAVISHLFDTSIIAYGLILSKFRYHKNRVGYFFLFFLLAAISHGFYDFWLLNESVRYFYLYTYAYMLLSMLIYTSFINNALNQSPYFRLNPGFDNNDLKKYLLTGLTAITMFEYVANALMYGTSHANNKIYGSIFFIGFFIAFLASNLSNFDLVKSHWARINLADFKQKLRYHKILGNAVVIKGTGSSMLNKYLPIKGVISLRENFSDETDYFIITLNESVKIQGEPYTQVVVKAKEERDLISAAPNVMIYFLTFISPDVMNKEKKEKTDLKFWDWAVISPL